MVTYRTTPVELVSTSKDKLGHKPSKDSLDPIPRPRRPNLCDSFSIDTLFCEIPSTHPATGRSFDERQDDFKSLDGVLDFREMDACFVEWDEFSGDSLRSDRTMSFCSQEGMSDSSPSTTSGRRSRVSRRQIVEASWIMDEDEETTTEPESFDELNKPGHLENTNHFLDFELDSSPLTQETLTEETYATIDQFDEKQSLSVSLIPLSTNKFSSRDGSQNSRSSSHANFAVGNSYLQTKSPNLDQVSSSTDVKRVRALFENSSASSSEDETNFSRKFNKANTSCKRLKESNSNTPSFSSFGSSSTMRSAYSHLSLNQMDRCDFADLLVNENVIIEDSPDVYQMFRLRSYRNFGGEIYARYELQRPNFCPLQDDFGQNSEDCSKNIGIRQRDNLGSSGTKVSSSASTFSRSSTLRRSKSVGAGIHQLEEDENMSVKSPLSSNEDESKDRPCILAEEMPARDTVKNVRTVFEQLFQNNRVNSHDNIGPVPTIINKSLSSIRSNPTSKILRSESMRSDLIRPALIVSNNIAKPITLTDTSPSKKTQEISKVFEPKGPDTTFPVPMPTAKAPASRTLPKVWPSASPKQQQPRFNPEDVGEDSSLHSLTNSTTADDNEDRKLISLDVLNRIRSCGTTTTYFGGEIVAKTVQNRKMAIVPRKSEEANDYEASSLDVSYPAEEIFFSARPNQPATQEKFNNNNVRRPFDLQFNSLIQPSVDSAPRIISVLPKSPSNSPTKSNSPVGSPAGGRNSPEGCESQLENPQTEWINDSSSTSPALDSAELTTARKPEDTNNNSIKFSSEPIIKSNKFSAAAEGAWF